MELQHKSNCLLAGFCQLHHYCGLHGSYRLVAEIIDEMGIRENTIGVAPVLRSIR
jgi:hypothetical protein